VPSNVRRNGINGEGKHGLCTRNKIRIPARKPGPGWPVNRGQAWPATSPGNWPVNRGHMRPPPWPVNRGHI
jgi:hypothetical protein